MLIGVIPNSIIVINNKGLYVVNGPNVLYLDFHIIAMNEMLDE
jgi:hypothetical protein